jgi:hypothetical protein
MVFPGREVSPFSDIVTAGVTVHSGLESMDPIGEEGGGGEKVSSELSERVADAPEFLKPAEHPVDEIALPVGDAIVRHRSFAPVPSSVGG